MPSDAAQPLNSDSDNSDPIYGRYPIRELNRKHFLCENGKHEACPGAGFYSDSQRVGENVVYTSCACECHIREVVTA